MAELVLTMMKMTTKNMTKKTKMVTMMLAETSTDGVQGRSVASTLTQRDCVHVQDRARVTHCPRAAVAQCRDLNSCCSMKAWTGHPNPLQNNHWHCNGLSVAGVVFEKGMETNDKR